MSPADELITQAADLSVAFDQNFLELARTLRELDDMGVEEFRRALASAKIGNRKGKYLVSIDRAFAKLAVSKTRLRKIGWTKLRLLAPIIDGASCQDLLRLAEQHTAKELEALVRGEDPASKKRPVVLYLADDDFHLLHEVLAQFGGIKTPRGMDNRELALMNLAAAVTANQAT